MPVKSEQVNPSKAKVVSRVEWRMQDTLTGKIYHRIYPSEERAQWHARKFNESGLRFNSSVRTQVVKVRSTYRLSLVEEKTPYKIKVLK
jgi:hypothetical protein